MDIKNSIQQRKSCRTFIPVDLKPADKEMLEEFISCIKTGINDEQVDFLIFEKTDSEGTLKIPYGLIRGNNTYIFGTIHSTAISRTNYGYLMQKIVLKATGMGLATCWVGMFDKEYFNDITIESGRHIPAILVIGYANEKKPFKEKLIRKAVSADKRKPWNTLYFNYETGEVLSREAVGLYAESLDMTRLAPSSGNTQPWRVFYSKGNDEFHFYKKPTNKSYEAKGMHDVDMGIAMCHFEHVALQNGLKGNWNLYPVDKIRQIDEMQYISTWTCN